MPNNSRFHSAPALAALAFFMLFGSTTAQKTRISKLADLPPHTYAIDGKPSELVEKPAAILALGAQVERDIAADLEKFDIADPTTLRRLHSTLLEVAMLRRDFQAARVQIEKVRSLQEKPAERLTSGLLAAALIATLESAGGDFQTTLRSTLELKLAALPYAEVQDRLKASKSSTEILSRNLLVGNVAGTIDPAAQAGQVSQELASALVSTAYALTYFIPNREAIGAAYTAVLDANKTARKADIWKDRDVTLDPSRKLAPVTVAVWDSGVDVAPFQSQLFSNSAEIAGNKIDDDKNGFVDDVHGFAWTMHSDPTADLLIPVKEMSGDINAFKLDVKGFGDLRANVDSPEATALKRKLATLPQDQVKPFLEGLTHYSQYAHGTHVAGIALRGNPAARLLIGRLTFDHRIIPETPTIEQAKKDTAAMVRSVDYFKRHGARVVNMSWGGDLKSIETALEQNNAGGTPEERKALARTIYDIAYKGLYDAIRQAPETLFVIAAGNSNNDVTFDEVFPSSFRLPNVLVVGAVDQAGDQTSFTSFGNVDVYANGFEVESFIPGGETMKFSGTSMSAPNAVNLAAKLWAVNSALTVAKAKQLILDGAETREAGGKKIRLIHPRKTLDLAK